MDGILNTFKSFVDTFRKPNENESKNEDVLKLKENILKIKKRRKNATNYSNIETLDSIYDNSSLQSEKGSESLESIPSYKDDSFVENFQEGARNKKKKNTSKEATTSQTNENTENTTETTTQNTKKKKGKKGKKGKKKKGKKKNGFKEKIDKLLKILQKLIDRAKKSIFYLRDEFDKLLSYISLAYVYII
jgi:hypothetical protein